MINALGHKKEIKLMQTKQTNTNQEIETTRYSRLTLKKVTQIVYICQAIPFPYGITFIVGMLINYLKIDEVKGSWLEPHFKWQLKTFWLALLFGVVGALLHQVLMIVAVIIFVYCRVVIGWLALRKGCGPAEE